MQVRRPGGDAGRLRVGAPGEAERGQGERCRDGEHGERRLVLAGPRQDDRGDERPDERASLVEGLVESEAPAATDRLGRSCEHRSSPTPATTPTTVAPAPRTARYGPVMLRAPS